MTEPTYCTDCHRELDSTDSAHAHQWRQCDECRAKEAYYDDLLHMELEGR